MHARSKICNSAFALGVASLLVSIAATTAPSNAPIIEAPPAPAPTTEPIVLHPGPTYNAISDTKYYAKPPLPKMGPAGTIIKDPTFGCPILRVTDETTYNHGDSIMTPASAEQCTWNTDSTLFCIHSSGMAGLVYRFDPKTMKATRVEGVPGDLDSFSRHDPNIAWGINKAVVFKYDFATGKSTEVLDVSKVSGIPTARTGAFHVSANDVISVIFGGKRQDEDVDFMVYNINDKTHHLWNTDEGTLDGKPLPDSAPKFMMHNATIDESGRYACAASSGASSHGSAHGPVVWDTQKGAVYTITKENTGHRVMGFGDMINDVHKWIYRTLDQEGVEKPKDLMEHPAGEAYFMYDSHLSWNNSRPDVKVPVLASNYHPREDPKCVYGDEIVAVATDGSMKVWRFAHHRSSVTEGKPTYNFWDTPRGNVSQDGHFFMFTSDWEDTLGKDRVGRFRDDVFIVKLERSPD